MTAELNEYNPWRIVYYGIPVTAFIPLTEQGTAKVTFATTCLQNGIILTHKMNILTSKYHHRIFIYYLYILMCYCFTEGHKVEWLF